MRTIFWGFRILIFLFLLSFAVKNTEPVAIRFFFGITWEAPFIVILLAFFFMGAVLGMVSLLGRVFGLRREIAGVRREAKREQARLEKICKEYEAEKLKRDGAPETETARGHSGK
ncbi:MAG: lipopolysaccharide assembly protein LapA domain-containing protein [Candidatus Accumulibacter sp.]|jgi:uncharacterized integral membrane protein|nr:lipopolysaccharide assembly protein LapA domain-containing protein [Accumulibacter sp.]